jgi:beta-lactamase class A
LLTFILGALSLGIFLGAGMVGILSPFQADRTEEQSAGREGTFRYIRNVAESRDEHAKLSPEMKPFRYKVNDLIQEEVKNGDASSVSVYFRDLNNGNWIGIGERETFSLKNQLKLPLMIAYFKWSESNPLVLRKSLTFAQKDTVTEAGAPTKTGLAPGSSYTVNDLIYRMITDDDNEAYRLLFMNIPKARLDKVYKDLNVEYDPHKNDDSLSLRGFAAFYRVLYNASYLNEEMSEKALRYLAKSSLKRGMASAIPMNVEIAGKYGERTFEVPEEGHEAVLYQMHEFGIVYHPRRPFLLGVMVRGDDPENLEKTIRDITRIVYEEVDSQS